MKQKTTTGACTALVLMSAPIAAFAALDTPAAFIAKIEEIQNWMFSFLLSFAAVFIIIAAFIFLTSAGDPKKTEKAKNTIIYAVIAIVIAFLARAIVGTVMVILG